jgi:hypothetical protein
MNDVVSLLAVLPSGVKEHLEKYVVPPPNVNVNVEITNRKYLRVMVEIKITIPLLSFHATSFIPLSRAEKILQQLDVFGTTKTTMDVRISEEDLVLNHYINAETKEETFDISVYETTRLDIDKTLMETIVKALQKEFRKCYPL